MMKRMVLTLASALAFSTLGIAELRFANIFGEKMVLQRDQPFTVWGWAGAGAAVTVSFGEQDASAKADGTGKWMVEFKALPASAEERELTVSGGGERKTLQGVLMGDVWLCGGQSNMAPRGHNQSDLEYRSANSPTVRYTYLESNISEEPAADLGAREKWMPLVDGVLEERRIGPVAYYFGVRLQRFLKVPIGIINCAVGGTTAEVWASRATQAQHPELAGLLQARGNEVGAFFNGTIVPISRMKIRGILFYQGENNTFDAYETYAYSFPAVIHDWRKAFGDEKLPFGIITLAGNKGMAASSEPERELTHRHGYPHIRDVHFRTHRSTANTGLIVIHDLGADDMHPSRKRDVGERAARWALATAYGYGAKGPREGVYHMAPIYRESRVDGDKLLLYFDYDPTIDDRREGKWYKRLPLPDRAREYRGFIIAGEDRRFFPAQAKVREVKKGQDLREECLEVWSEVVPNPVAVRYAWASQPNANAYGLKGLPVAPFRTDHWPFIRALPKWASDLAKREKENEKFSRQQEEWRRERIIEEAKRVLRELGVE